MWTEEQIEKQLSELTRPEVERLVSNLQKIALFVGKRELQKMLARKITRFEKRLSAIEKWQKEPASISKSITGQDDESENDLWPSLSKLIF